VSDGDADRCSNTPTLLLPPPLSCPGHHGCCARSLCNDCHAETDARFHIVGMKCRAPLPPAAGGAGGGGGGEEAGGDDGGLDAGICGSYNTRRVGNAKDAHDDAANAAEDAREDAWREAVLVRAADALGGPLLDDSLLQADDDVGSSSGEEGEGEGEDGEGEGADSAGSTSSGSSHDEGGGGGGGGGGDDTGGAV
jgi:hypothetical protein